jgi:predicted small lipoprotein YifL
MRNVIVPGLAVILVCMSLAACGGTERKTVIVNPPPNSTTVVDQNGNAHTVPNN